MRGHGTDHKISRAMRGLKKLYPMAQTDRQIEVHGNSMIESAQWVRFSEFRTKCVRESPVRKASRVWAMTILP